VGSVAPLSLGAQTQENTYVQILSTQVTSNIEPDPISGCVGLRSSILVYNLFIDHRSLVASVHFPEPNVL